MAEEDYYLLGGADDAGSHCDLYGEDHSAEFIYTINRGAGQGTCLAFVLWGGEGSG